MLCGFLAPLEFFKKAHDGGQMKAIIISWIIMNIFIILMRAWSCSRYGFGCGKQQRDQQDMKPTAAKSFFTIMNKRLPCLIMERFIVYHRDM
jgi:hypothetical protein